MVVNELRENVNREFETVSQLPPQAEYTFDSPAEFKDKPLVVQKTVHRNVVSLNFSKFKAREVIRTGKNKVVTVHSSKLANIVPSGARYGVPFVYIPKGQVRCTNCTNYPRMNTMM